MNIGTVVEGPTDRVILESILSRLIPGRHRFFPLQPMDTFGETGTGWKGVRRWCRDTWRREPGGLEKFLSGSAGPEIDLLVIQMDADVAKETDLFDDDEPAPFAVRKPCPPVEDSADGLRRLIEGWLTSDPLPLKVILTITAQDIEHWIFAALFPGEACCGRKDYECPKPERNSPAYLLSLKKYGKWTTRKSGTIKKQVVRYRKCAGMISNNITHVENICTQGRQFFEDVRSFQTQKSPE
jgi:hypothetical protein